MRNISNERQNRIRLCIAAYAYELTNNSIMSDAEYDQLAYSINPEIETGNEILDKFFKEEFNPYTSMWIYKHPELDKIALLYEKQIREETVRTV